MADLYRVIYVTKKGANAVAYVSATSVDNAVAACKTNDTDHKLHVTATMILQNIVSGS
jgi:hypothetical protein